MMKSIKLFEAFDPAPSHERPTLSHDHDQSIRGSKEDGLAWDLLGPMGRLKPEADMSDDILAFGHVDLFHEGA